MTSKEYYNLCSNLDKLKTFGELHDAWYRIFDYTLRSWKLGYRAEIIDDLFYHWDMSNWKAMHKENTEYANHSDWDLHQAFTGDVAYISDRMSYDRLFRAHWLFREAYSEHLKHHIYPTLYPECKDDDPVHTPPA